MGLFMGKAMSENLKANQDFMLATQRMQVHSSSSASSSLGLPSNMARFLVGLSKHSYNLLFFVFYNFISKIVGDRLKGPNPFLTHFNIVLKGPNPYDIGPKSEKMVLTCSVLCCKVLSASIQFFSSPEQFEKSGLGPFSLSPTMCDTVRKLLTPVRTL